MDAHGINRLREEQQIAIEQSSERIKQLNTYKEDYKTLSDRLNTLPDKITHDIMVPFGPLAFMPGQLVHTNEVLVLLGDNWFADRSVSQAAGIISRRIKAIDQQINEVEKQKGLLEPRLEFTSELQDITQGKGDIVEIQEKYDPESEKLWREQHKKSVQRYHQQLKKQEGHRNYTKSTADLGDDFWKRLDQLELQESEHNEMELRSEESEGSEDEETSDNESEESDDTSGKMVRWRDETKPSNTSNIITFSHTTKAAESPVKSMAASNVDKRCDEIQSPGDIVRLFAKAEEPMSILKSPSHEFPIVKPVQEEKLHTVLKTDAEAFTGAIIERPTHVTQPGTIVPKDNVEEMVQFQPHRISKFKSERTESLHSPPCVVGETSNLSTDEEHVKELHADGHNQQPNKRVSKFKAGRKQAQR